MKLAIFNGSPRGKNSNTNRLLDAFIAGFKNNGGEVDSYNFLIKEKSMQEFVDNFRNAETIFLAFPLYVDSMPGIVKNFIETIGDIDGKQKKILFLVHSGFPEGIHSVGVAKYLELLAQRWNMKCLGTIVKPGSESIRMMPESKSKKLFQNFQKLGEDLAKTGVMDIKAIERMKKPLRFPVFVLGILRLLSKTQILNGYWNLNLKKYDVFEKRFDAPYLENNI